LKAFSLFKDLVFHTQQYAYHIRDILKKIISIKNIEITYSYTSKWFQENRIDSRRGNQKGENACTYRTSWHFGKTFFKS